jgi:DNA topoisomerase-1
MSALQRHIVRPQDVGLVRADLDAPGYARCERDPDRFYSTAKKTISKAEMERLRGLAVPPAWSDVWISKSADTHILALGTDASGRRQYIYHPDWRAACEAAKFSDLGLFAARLPRLRRQVRRALSGDPGDPGFAIATIIRLMDRAGLRIGNWKGPNEGAVTLAEEHIDLDGDELNLEYTGKGGKTRSVELEDPFLAQAISALSERPGDHLFELQTSKIRPSHVNAFIQDAMGHAFSAKDFRTWGGSVRAAKTLFASSRRVTIKAVSEAAADWLGNTPGIARSSYIHPAIIEKVPDAPLDYVAKGPTALRKYERACFALIED